MASLDWNKSTIEMKQEQDEKENKTYKNRLHFKMRSDEIQ